MTAIRERAGMPGLIAAALGRFGTARLPVAGESMLPTLRPGEHVLVRAIPFADVRAGDVIAFRFGAGVVVHRVLIRRRDVLHTAGDNLGLYDLPVTEPDFLGVIPDVAPAPARRVRWPAGRGARHLWLFGDACPRPALPGWTVHVRPRVGAGIGADTLREILGNTQGAPVLGVSEFGVLPAAEVLAAPLPAGTHVLLGCRFGGSTCDGGGRLLPPEAASVHVRLGVPCEGGDIDRACVEFVALLGKPGEQVS